jgi:predicted anti-sigma-YlaC factor YlaD
VASTSQRPATAGNFAAGQFDKEDVDVQCDQAREAISAILDDEDPGLPVAAVDGHVAGCAECTAWRDSAAAVTRMTRLESAVAVPDLTAAVLDRVPLPKPSRWPARLRWALGLIAVGQLAVGASQLLAPMGAVAASVAAMAGGHMSHETGAFNVALAVVLMWVALRPAQAGTQLPVLLSFVAVLTLAVAVDLLDGEVGWARLTTHVPVVAGLVFTVLLRRYAWPSLGPSGRAVVPPLPQPATSADQVALRAAADPPDQHHSPAAHRRAA